MTAPLSEQQLAEIRDGRYQVRSLAAADEHITALLAEVERLRTLLHDVQKIARDRMAEAKGREKHGKQLEVRVAELESERHATNEALSDTAEALRVKDQRIAELEKDSALLNALEVAGVDNWEGYDDACEGL